MIFELEPVVRDKLGRKIAEYSLRHFYEKMSEELLEAHEAAVVGSTGQEATELLDLMTACTTRLKALKMSERELNRLQKKIYERNKERGYLEENL